MNLYNQSIKEYEFSPVVGVFYIIHFYHQSHEIAFIFMQAKMKTDFVFSYNSFPPTDLFNPFKCIGYDQWGET